MPLGLRAIIRENITWVGPHKIPTDLKNRTESEIQILS